MTKATNFLFFPLGIIAILTSNYANAQEHRISPDLFLETSISLATTNFSGGTSQLAGIATDIDLGFDDSSAVKPSFAITDNKSTGFNIIAGTMLTEKFGIIVNYSTPTKTKYNYTANTIVAAPATTNAQASSKYFGIQGRGKINIDKKMAITASLGMCNITQNHHTSPAPGTISKNIQKWVGCANIGSSYILDEKFGAFINYGITSAKGQKTSINKSIVKTSSINIGINMKIS